jgi:GTP-binding protein Era
MNEGTRAGHVALVGRPNVGKSTLLNALVGEKLSIVTPRAQTTRDAVTGILTTGRAQLIFVDTPGLLEPQYTLHRSMQETAFAALQDADVVLLLLDATRPAEVPEGEALAALRKQRHTLLAVVNKVDAAPSGPAALESWCERELGVRTQRISAVTKEGLEALLTALESALPVAPFYYPPDELAVQPVRFFVAELVRETVFEEYEDELPYATVVRIEEYREASEPIYIRATVYVERASQKAIVVGRGGAGIKRLGAQARAKIESFVGAPVYLDLWVKVLPGWRRKAETLRYLGYPVPAAGETGGGPGAAGGAKARGTRSGRVPGDRG